jgi:hypothetical protein
VIATRARDVIGAEVAEACMTCRKGCSNDGVSNLCISAPRQVLSPSVSAGRTFATSQFSS